MCMEMGMGGPHGKMTAKLMGVGLVVVGVLWWLTKADVLDGGFWDWLLPLLVILYGVGMAMMSMCSCEKCRGGGCEGGSCENCKHEGHMEGPMEQ